MRGEASGEETCVSTEEHLGGHESGQGTKNPLLSSVREGEQDKIKLERQVRAQPWHAEDAKERIWLHPLGNENPSGFWRRRKTR